MKVRNIVMLVILVALFVAAGVVLVVAIVTHEEPTLMGACWPQAPASCSAGCRMEPDRYEVDGTAECPPLTWPENQGFPLSVGLYGEQDDEMRAVQDAVGAINEQLGFDALEFSAERSCAAEHAVCVNMNEASEPGWTDPGGSAGHTWTGAGLRCEVITSNAGMADITHDVLRHELLHCLGLAHDPEDQGSIMYPTQRSTPDLRGYRHIRDADRAELRQRYLIES